MGVAEDLNLFAIRMYPLELINVHRFRIKNAKKILYIEISCQEEDVLYTINLLVS